MRAIYLITAFTFIAVLLGCGDSDNNPPIIERVTTSKLEVAPGEEVTIDVSASDPDGDKIVYKYEVSDGEIKGSGRTILWKATKEGTYLINVTVCDDCGHSAQTSISITVKGVWKAEYPILVNLQVTEYKDPSALQKVINEIEARGIKKVTIFVGKEMAENNCSLIKELDKKGYEIAAFGYALDEKGEFIQLANLSKVEQEMIISGLKESLENCLGHRVAGFRAQRFSQNRDTNQIVRDLNFIWHGSFVSGRSFLPGHENDVVPYYSSEYGFYVVPMIGVEVQPGRISALCDTSLDSVVESPDQWKDIVKDTFVKKSQERLPFLTEFHPYFLIGNPDWWDSFIELLDWLGRQNVTFVTTIELAKAYCLPCQGKG